MMSNLLIIGIFFVRLTWEESENIRARHIPNPLCKINKSIIKIRTYVITVITRKTLVVFIGEFFFAQLYVWH